MKEPAKTGLEHDVIGKFRRNLCYLVNAKGLTKRAKNSINRRMRRKAKKRCDIEKRDRT